jgi:serine/threonine-protein kinase
MLRAMRGEPPAKLVNMLERLRLATAAQVDQVAPRVRRLAGELPDFESVWVDALQQARVLTPLQAGEINAGRGESLVCGPYVLASRLASPHFAECFAAVHLESARRVRLYRIARPQIDASSAARQIQRLIEQLAPLVSLNSGIVQQVGIDGDAVWAACSWLDGVTAAQWMSEYGRFPAQVVLHIAREMASRLTALETLSAVHGDLSCAGLLLDRSGQVMLPMPGLRGIVRPAEGYSFDDLPVEAYDYLSPERIAAGAPPTAASDLYACGCVWWHLLTGRAPFAGGNGLSKLKAVHAARLADVKQIASEVPEPLCRAIEWCTMRDPVQRPGSMSEVRQLLGAPARGGPALVVRALQGEAWLWQPIGQRRAKRTSPKHRLATAVAAIFLCCLGAGVWQVTAGKRTAEQPQFAAAAPIKETAKPIAASGSAEKNTAGTGSPTVRPATIDPEIVPTAAVVAKNDPATHVMLLRKETRANDLRLHAGQVVRSDIGHRAVILVTGEGLSIDCEDVSFEGVDFVWQPESAKKLPADRLHSIVTVAASRVSFQGCSFSTEQDVAPAAVTWQGPTDAPADDGELLFSDCVFRGVQAVVDCAAARSLNVELKNTLCVAAGPMVRLRRSQPEGTVLAISLDHVTTRGDCGLLECRYGQLENDLGAIVITVNDSALVTNPRGALLAFAGPQRPAALLRAITWNGQGSLVTDETAVAEWRDAAGREHVLDEDELEIGGLVRSEVSFAGAAYEPPHASRITRWNAPLQSDSAPGCDTSSLRLPENRATAP